MKIVVAVTGASGVVIAKRLLENLMEHETHVIISKSAEKVISHELSSKNEIKKFAKFLYGEDELESKLSSSSFVLDAMVVVPCSMKTLAAIANGLSQNLITRCADNVLKCNRKLVVVPRDTPLSLPAIENMRKVKISGGIVLPANIAYYHKPKEVSEMTDFIVGKIMDVLNLDHELYKRWGGLKKKKK